MAKKDIIILGHKAHALKRLIVPPEYKEHIEKAAREQGWKRNSRSSWIQQNETLYIWCGVCNWLLQHESKVPIGTDLDEILDIVEDVLGHRP